MFTLTKLFHKNFFKFRKVFVLRKQTFRKHCNLHSYTCLYVYENVSCQYKNFKRYVNLFLSFLVILKSIFEEGDMHNRTEKNIGMSSKCNKEIYLY